jgi:hypothetical protein
MNVKTVLARLQSTLDLDDRMDKLLLLPRLTDPTTTPTRLPSAALAVGYDGSVNSQAALDLAFCVAHQMQLATQQQVMIHVVYITAHAPAKASQIQRVAKRVKPNVYRLQSQPKQAANTRSGKSLPLNPSPNLSTEQNEHSLDEIDRVLWQARCLAEEWRGSFTAHLRFGELASELESFVKEEQVALLFLGCHSATHPLVQALKDSLPCSIVGIPVARPCSASYSNSQS